ncbi:MAG: alpha-galactosidase, partial [Dehalococcoidales bacterium]|nr:alpha-galactosidase [Dehalococcoidales bacterium]
MTNVFRQAIDEVLPSELCRHLGDGPGWQVEHGQQVLEWESLGAPERRRGRVVWHAVHNTGLDAEVTVEQDFERTAVRLQVNLTNHNSSPSIPLSAIKPLVLLWPELSQEVTRLRGVGGGSMEYYYPPSAYRVNDVMLRRTSIAPDSFRVESAPDGRSSGTWLPFLQMTLGDPVNAGLVVALEWSGKWYQQLRCVRTTQVTMAPDFILEAGIPVEGIILDPGETLALPTVHIIGFRGDQDDGSNACRRYVNERICPPLADDRPLPLTNYCHWFWIGTDYDEALLRKQVDRAAELGVEEYLLGGAWNVGTARGGEYKSGVGNWDRADPQRFPNGLESFADYVRGKGLRFGLWFDIEDANRNSDLARQHPDWLIDIGSENLHLNLGIREAQDYAINTIGGWLRRLSADRVRLDYNLGPAPYWKKLDPTGKIQFQHVAGLYTLLDALRHDFPNCTIDDCASGGRRIDLGYLRRAHLVFISDYTEGRTICRFMQLGANRFLPGHLLNCTVATTPGAGDAPISDAVIISRMAGALSINGDIASWSPELTVRVANLVRSYKEFRHLLKQDFYPLTPQA